MVMGTRNRLHPSFKINGVSCNKEALNEIAYSLIKEGDFEEQLVGDFLQDWLSDEDTIIVSTSGSTGKPKEVSIVKDFMINSAKATMDFFQLQEGDSALLCLSARYIAGKMMLVRAMVHGLELDMVSPSQSPLKNLRKNYDFCAMVPMQLRNSIKEISYIKNVIIGGAPISPFLKQKIIKTGHNGCYETYGMTETITHIALKKISEPTIKNQENPFKILPNVSISTDDRNCLVIDAPSITRDKVVTNDMVKLLSDTEFIWLGRLDNVINSGGIKLMPEMIEAKLSVLLDCPFFVTSVADEVYGEKLVIVIEGDENESYFDLIKKSELEAFEKPKDIFFIPKLHRAANGKLLRKKSLYSFLNT